MTDPDAAIAGRLAALRARIERAAKRAGRSPEAVSLVGVSKRKSAAEVAAAVRAGVAHIGENYVQEAISKVLEVNGKIDPDRLPCWHFVGQLQRNKAGRVAELFDVVETVDRASLGEALSRRALAAARTLRVLLQVNVSGEAQKGGLAPDALPALLEASRSWQGLRVTGLMAIPAAATDPEASRPAFARLRKLRDALRDAPGGGDLDQLSMGMSGDFEVAIEEGATIIRVGTALFGPRSGFDGRTAQ